MKVSDVIAKYLHAQGVEVIFGYQGGAITHMIDSFDRMGIKYIQNYNEQGSSIAADAYARVSELGMGVAIGTNGPGATNMVTGIANAYCDSIPVLYLTGQVHTFAMKKDERIRQESFQEIDILSIVRPITKYAVTVMDKEQILPEIKKAIAIAKEGRPGPVLVDLPVDIQGQDLAVEEADFAKAEPVSKKSCTTAQVEPVLNLIRNAKRPLIIAGAGIQGSKAADAFAQFVEKLQLPVAASLLGLDALDQMNPLYVGYIGGYGNRYANLAVQNADVILVLGSRLDMRQTGKRRDLFAKDAKLIHIDIDEVELGHFVPEEYALCADLCEFLQVALQMLNEEEHTQNSTTQNTVSQIAQNQDRNQLHDAWMAQIADWKAKYPATAEFAEKTKTDNLSKVDTTLITNPNAVMDAISKKLAPQSIVCGDVGQNQMWMGQSIRGKDIRILSSGGLGAMGYSLPASIGAAYARENTHVIALMGDGGLQMNIQELQVLGQYQLPITVIVMNNHSLGLIRDIHEKYYDCRYVGSVNGFSMPELESLAKAYHLGYRKAQTMEELEQSLAVMDEKKPAIIEVVYDGYTYVRPELLGNDGLDHQFPYVEE